MFIGIETTTGDYFSQADFDFYETKIPGDYLGGDKIRDNSGSASFSKEFPSWLTFNNIATSDSEWQALKSSDQLTTDMIISFTGSRVRSIHDLNIEDINDEASTKANLEAITYVELQATTELRKELDDATALKADHLELWQTIYDRLYPSLYPARYASRFSFNYNKLYEEVMLEDDFFTRIAKVIFQLKSINQGSNFILISGDDWNETLLRIYLKPFPEEFVTVYEQYDNYFYEKGGFFA